MLDASYETVTIHAAGCYTGTKSSGTHIHVTATGPWPLEGSSVPAPDPSYFSSTTTGNTWWVARPVYGAPLGIDLLLTPSVMLSGAGVWYAYDYSTKACSNGTELIYFLGEAWGPGNFWTLGLKDLRGGGSGTGSCTALTAMNPIFIKLWFATYTP